MKTAHNFCCKLSRLPWWYCVNCGLLLLSNKATKSAASKPCKGTPDE